MGGGGGLFGSQQTTLQPPTPVSTIPGAQNLGQALVNYYMRVLGGGNARTPYMGYSSVYGGPGGTFPSSSFYGTPTPSAPSAPASANISTQDIQSLINQAVANATQNVPGTPGWFALNSPSMTGAAGQGGGRDGGSDIGGSN